MVDLPKKKVGIVACSGEELSEGTVTRLAALELLEHLRPNDTVTICLPLFLAGGEGDRAFARFYPTIAVDGCELRCAARATELYSAKPAGSIVVTELIDQHGLERPQGARRLDQAGMAAVHLAAARMAELVDTLLEKKWNRRTGDFVDGADQLSIELIQQTPVVATCACGSGIPVCELSIAGQKVTLIALPLIFDQFYQGGKLPVAETALELLDTIKIYNPVSKEAEESYTQVLLQEYAVYCAEKECAQ